jgi:hypothetical protein
VEAARLDSWPMLTLLVGTSVMRMTALFLLAWSV